MTPDAALAFLRLSLTGGLNPPVGPIPFYAPQLQRWGLRDYQEAMLRLAIGYMQAGVRRILLQAPTGAGKTQMAKAMHGSAAELGLTSEFMVHRKELVDQTSRTFAADGIAHGFIAAGHPFNPDALVRIAGVQTLANRLDRLLPPNLAIVDECHHATAATWQRVFDAYPEAFIIGLTATPERLDGRGLRPHFDAMIEGPPVADLIERGFLSDFDYYAPGQEPDLTGVHTTAGDFNRGEIAELMDKPKLIGDVVEHYLRLAPGQMGIVFAASREHSRNIAQAFRSEGIEAAHVDGDMDDQRDELVEAFRAGQIRVMSNVDLFGEGFDVPGIVYAGLARPSKSLTVVMQQWGRALRMFEGNGNAILSDHAGNAFRHGLPDDPRSWSLDGRAARQRAAGGTDDALPVRQCKACFRVSPSVVKVCPGCGEEFPAQIRTLKQEEGTLTKLERQQRKEAARVRRKVEERACKSYEDFKQLAQARGYPRPGGWARVQWKLRHGGTVR